MSLASWLGVLSPAHINWFTWFTRADLVGIDQYNNKYYKTNPRKGYKLDRRWVIYKGIPEASSVPPEWHGWLHHQTDNIPENTAPSFRRKWQKPHIKNATGTKNAYRPPGHLLAKGLRDKATGDYEAWQPPQ